MPTGGDRSSGDGSDRPTRAVLFDLDNTLYPYPPCNRAGKAAAREAAGELGYEFADADAFEAFYRRGREEVKREVPGTAASHERYLYFEAALEERVGRARPADALALGDAFWGSYLDAMAPFPDVEETLIELRDRGIDVAIVTNLTTRIQLRKLARLGIGEHVDALVTSESVGREKPGSAPFTRALSTLDRRPSEAVMVGDNVDADVRGGNAVGLETVLFRGDADEPLTGPRNPDHRIDAVADVLEVIS